MKVENKKTLAMIAYNITTKVTWTISKEWLIWQKEEHLPEMMLTGLFASYNIFRLLEQDDEEGPTFTIQFFLETWEKYEEYLRSYSSLLRQRAVERWGNNSIAFRTVMQLVN